MDTTHVSNVTSAAQSVVDRGAECRLAAGSAAFDALGPATAPYSDIGDALAAEVRDERAYEFVGSIH